MRVCIVGAGGVGAAHAIAVQQYRLVSARDLPEVSLVGVCDTDPEVLDRYRQTKLVNQWGTFSESATLPTDLVLTDKLSELPPADLIIVATPDATHEAVVAELLARDPYAHTTILVEKPASLRTSYLNVLVGYEWNHTVLHSLVNDPQRQVAEVAMGHNYGRADNHVGLDLLPHVLMLLQDSVGLASSGLDLTCRRADLVVGTYGGISVRAAYNPTGRHASVPVTALDHGVGEVEWVITYKDGHVVRCGWIPNAFVDQLTQIHRHMANRRLGTGLTTIQTAQRIEREIAKEIAACSR